MSTLQSLQVLAAGAAWRLAGLDPAGRRLIEAVEGDDEDAATLAGMMLTQAGERTADLVARLLESGAGSAQLVTVLESIATPQAERLLERMANRGDEPVARAARRALADLTEIRRRER